MSKCKVKSIAIGAGSEAIAQVGEARAYQLAAMTMPGEGVPTVSSVIPSSFRKGPVGAGTLSNVLNRVRAFNASFGTNSFLKIEATENGRFDITPVDNYSYGVDQALDEVNDSDLSESEKAAKLNEIRSTYEIEQFKSDDMTDKLVGLTADEVHRLDRTIKSGDQINAVNTIRESMNLPKLDNMVDSINSNMKVSDLADRVAIAEKILGRKITLSTTGNYKGRVSHDANGTPIVSIDATIAEKDTVFHEVIGHVFINSIGGLDNKRVSRLAELLESDETDVWAKVVSENPNYTREQLQLEAVAQSVGLASDQLFENKAHQGSFKRFLEYLWNRLSQLFDVQPREAYLLAREGFNSDFTRAKGAGTFYQSEQKGSMTDMVTDLKESNIPNTPGYVEFLPDSHEYVKAGRVNATSVTNIANGGKFIRYENPITAEDFNANINIPAAFRKAVKEFHTFNNVPVAAILNDERMLGNVNETAAIIQEGYDRTAEWGTEVHAVFEDIINGGATEGYRSEYKAIVAEAIKFREIAKKPGMEVIVESRLFDEETGIAGSVDMIVINKKAGTTEIYDFKTKMSLVEDHVSEIPLDSLEGYARQLSLYAAMLEAKYDISVTGLNIVPVGMGYDENYTALEHDSVIGETIDLTKLAKYGEIKDAMNARVVVNNISSKSLDNVSNVLKDRILENLKSSIRDKAASNTKVDKDRAKKILQQINEDFELKQVESIVAYTAYLQNTIAEMTDVLANSSSSLSVDRLHDVRGKLKALNVLDDIQKYLDANADVIGTHTDFKQLTDAIADMKAVKAKHTATVLSLSTKVLAIKLAGLSNLQRIESKDRAIIEFQRLNPKTLGIRTKYEFGGKQVTAAEWNEQLEISTYNFIKNQISKNDQKNLDYWHKYLQEGYVDLSKVELFTGDAIASSSILIQTVNKLFSEAELKTRENVMERRLKFDNALKAISEKTGKSIKELHEISLDKDADGNPNGMLVNKYNNEVYYAFNEIDSAMSRLRVDGKSESSEFADLQEQRTKLRAKYLDTKGVIKSKYLNPAYKANSDIIDLYSKLTEDADAHLGFGAKLTKKIWDIDNNFHRIPSVRHSTVEAALTHGLMAAGKEYVGDAFTHRSDDETQEGIDAAEKEAAIELDKTSVGVNVSVDGSEVKDVPIYFRGVVPAKEQSHDLSTLLMNNYEMSINFNNKSAIQPSIELLLDVMEDNRPMESNGITGKIKRSNQSANGRPVRLNTQSNEFQSLQSIVELRLYGISTKKGMSTKVIQAVTKYTANTMLIANYMAGINNFNVGQTANFLESLGNPHMTPGTLMKAKKVYYSDMKNIMSDIGKPVPRSRTNLLTQYFNIQGEFETLGTEYYKDNAALKVLSSSNLHFMSSIGEHAIQGQLVYGIMEGLKIMNNKGEYLDKDGNVTTKDKAASLNEVTDISSGSPKYSVDFFATSLNPTQAHSMNEVGNYMQATAKSLHGQYNDDQKSLIQRNAWGAAMFSMRKWIVSLAKARFKGISTAHKEWDGLDVNDKSYSEARLQFDEGRYTSFGRFMIGVGKDMFKLKQLTMSDNWNKLNTTQQDNVRKTLYDAAIMMGSVFASALLMGLRGDDKDDRALLASAYFLRRLYSESAFFINPLEFMRTARTPAVGLSMLENMTRLLGRALAIFPAIAGDPDSALLARFEKGTRKGQLKIARDLQKVMPIYSQASGVTNLPDKYKYLLQSF